MKFFDIKDPRVFRPEFAQRALDGDSREIIKAFEWQASPQGHRFWEIQNYNGLTEEGRAILEHWVEKSK